jgi:CheY-like chemotaxis protein
MCVDTIHSTRVVGIAGFPALLLDSGHITRNDLTVAEQRAAGDGIPLADAIVALGVISEAITSDRMRDAIARGATAHEIRAEMRSAGFPTMRDHALQLVADGITSIEEVNRVLAEDAPVRLAGNTTRVLVTDDEPITRMLVKLLLEREQYEVLEAANGRDAIDIAVREHPDLVLIDLNMPQMDGYEALARLRRNFTLTTMPIIVLTSEEGPGVERRVLDLGADDYILKPFDPAVLLSRVQAVFRRLKVAAA